MSFGRVDPIVCMTESNFLKFNQIGNMLSSHHEDVDNDETWKILMGI